MQPLASKECVFAQKLDSLTDQVDNLICTCDAGHEDMSLRIQALEAERGADDQITREQQSELKKMKDTISQWSEVHKQNAANTSELANTLCAINADICELFGLIDRGQAKTEDMERQMSRMKRQLAYLKGRKRTRSD